MRTNILNITVKLVLLSLLATPAFGKIQMGGLFKAISNYDYEAVNFLLKQRGARQLINTNHHADGDVFTPLQWAIHTMLHGSYRDEYKYLKLPNIKEREQALKIVDLIMMKGGDPNVYDFNGDTPLHQATRSLHQPLIELLLTNQANINALNAAGETVLHVIARDTKAYRHRDEVASFLLYQGADPTVTNTNDQLAIDLAKTSGDAVIEKILSNNWWLIFNSHAHAFTTK